MSYKLNMTGEEFENKIKNPQPVNLLDNSDFTNPVNQRGQNTYVGEGFLRTIDRWQTQNATTTVTTYDGKGINVYSEQLMLLYQSINPNNWDWNTTYTLAVWLDDGTVECLNGTTLSAQPSSWTWVKIQTFNKTCLGIALSSTGVLEVAMRNLSSDSIIKYCALYKGEYTLETLPSYHPKGYAAELAECQRYYYHSPVSIQMAGYISSNALKAYGYLYIPLMRKKPTLINSLPALTIRTIDGYSSIANNTSPYGTPTAQSLETDPSLAGGEHCVCFTFASEIGTNNTPITLSIRNSGYLELSAEI